MTNCTPLWREAHFEVKMYKAPQLRSTFRSCDVEEVHAVLARSTFANQNAQSTPGSDHFWKLTYRKVHAVVARSTFPSQNAQNISVSDHVWKLRCRKSARRCGAKHIAKSKCTKHTMLGPLWRLRCRKSARRWREAHFQVKRDGFGALLDVQMSFCVAGGVPKSQNALVQGRQLCQNNGTHAVKRTA